MHHRAVNQQNVYLQYKRVAVSADQLNCFRPSSIIRTFVSTALSNSFIASNEFFSAV